MFDNIEKKVFDNIENTNSKYVEKLNKAQEEKIIAIAKLRADMLSAIAVAPTENICNQLRYRLKHHVYKYDDLVDPLVVQVNINLLKYNPTQNAIPIVPATLDENGNIVLPPTESSPIVCKEVTI